LLTVLVEGDDLNEPVSDALRAILDGHIVLSRQIAHQGQYPAIDILKSASRLMPDLTSVQQRELAVKTVQVLALLDRNHQMVELGAYEQGTNSQLDAALAVREKLLAWLRQSEGGVARADSWRQLDEIIRGFVAKPPAAAGAGTQPARPFRAANDKAMPSRGAR
jgi:flagellum-specific ATP synthase